MPGGVIGSMYSAGTRIISVMTYSTASPRLPEPSTASQRLPFQRIPLTGATSTNREQLLEEPADLAVTVHEMNFQDPVAFLPMLVQRTHR